jgi:hypothetical protein
MRLRAGTTFDAMTLAVQNPATGRETFHVDDVPPIMALADTAQREWAKVPPRDKAEILLAGFSGSEPIRDGSGTSKSGPSRSLPLMWSIGLPYQPRISHW